MRWVEDCLWVFGGLCQLNLRSHESIQVLLRSYSVRKLFIGLAVAARDGRSFFNGDEETMPQREAPIV